MTNVLFLDPHIPGLEVTRKAGLVATITGTTGLEAAILGVPVLSFGKYNMYNMLPHVRYVNSWLEITPAVRELTRDFESGRKRREANGRRFLRAMVDISVDCGETDFKSEVEPELLESIMALLEKTLPQRSAAA
jgi:predicted glycosyltransferase